MQRIVLKSLLTVIALAWAVPVQAQPGETVDETVVGCLKLRNANCTHVYSSVAVCSDNCVPPSGLPGTPWYQDAICPNGAEVERVVPASITTLRPALVGETGHSVFNQQDEVVCVERKPCTGCREVSLLPGFFTFICTPDPDANWGAIKTELVLTPAGEPCDGEADPDTPDGGFGIG